MKEHKEWPPIGYAVLAAIGAGIWLNSFGAALFAWCITILIDYWVEKVAT